MTYFLDSFDLISDRASCSSGVCQPHTQVHIILPAPENNESMLHTSPSGDLCGRPLNLGAFELKSGTPVTPALGKVHTNFGF